MRFTLALTVMMGAAAPGLPAQQSTKTPPGACAILTRDLVVAHSPASKQSLDVTMKIPPQEDTIGATGSACQYGDVMLQINPFPIKNFDAMFGKWTAVSGVGDRAYFRDNRGEWAELALLSGDRMITVQMDVPSGKKATDIQSNTIALAKAVLAKLK